jgi:hypothetical protein
VNALRGALNNTKKASMTMAQFFAKMKGYASDLVALGKTLDESELITYLLNGLDGTYNDAIASANGQPGITVDELYDQLTAHDLRHSMLQDTGDSFTSSVNLVRRGQGDTRSRGRADDDNRGPRGRRWWLPPQC